MPHFIVDCSENVLKQKSPDEIMKALFMVAKSSGLFADRDIKVRLNPYTYYSVENSTRDFIHVFSHIMEGRNDAQKAALSAAVLSQLKSMFPEVSVISTNIIDFEKPGYASWVKQ